MLFLKKKETYQIYLLKVEKFEWGLSSGSVASVKLASSQTDFNYNHWEIQL